jgi:peptide/nickel transport system permease protein
MAAFARAYRTWSGLLGLVGVSVFLALAIFVPVIAPYSPNETLGSVWEPPSAHFVLGTDSLGRDLFSRVLYALRLTIFVASVTTMLSFALGGSVGFLTANFGGWFDQIISRLNDLLMSVPTLISALVVLSVLPRNISVLILVMGVLDATRVFRLARAVALNVLTAPFIEAARLRGEHFAWIIFREMLPNVTIPLIVEFGLRFAFAILFMSSLSFLGLGIQPPATDLGRMVRDNKEGIIFGVSASLVPAAIIMLLAVAVNMAVDGFLAGRSHVRPLDPTIKSKKERNS